MPAFEPYGLPLMAGVVAFSISAAATPLVRGFARRYGFVAQPRPDRWHKKPTALLGGIAVYLAITAPLLLSSGSGSRLLLLAVGLTGIFALGLVDDLVKLAPYQKLVGQIAIASLVSAGGVVFDGVPIKVLAVPLTVFWLVAITNAFNLLDNMDGLSAGIAGVTGAVLVAMGLLGANREAALVGALVVGATAGFLPYNSSPASIFMGDSGSMVLGFAVGGLAVLSSGYGTPQGILLTVIVPIAVLGVPLFDTTLVSVVRKLHGRPISQGGRDHTSHRLVALGLSEKWTVWVLYTISAVFGAFAVGTRFVDLLVSIALLILLMVGLVLFGVYLAQVKMYREEEIAPIREGRHPLTVIGGALMHKMRLAEVLLDLALVFVSYLGAYLLKFEGTISGPFLAQFTQSLPFVMALKLAALLLLGAYGGVWRYVGLPEVVQLSKASVVGSALCAAAVTALWGFEGYSRSVFVIDWLLFTWLVVVSRMSFRLLAHLAQSLGGTTRKKLIIVGSRDLGAVAVRAFQDGQLPDYVPVGFVTVDGEGRERRVSGVEVLGDIAMLGPLLDDHEADGVVIALSGRHAEHLEAVVRECVARGLPYRRIAPLDSGWNAGSNDNSSPPFSTAADPC